RLYNEKFKSAGAILGARFGYVEPEGGFFLWLDMAAQGGGEAAAMTLWRRGGVKVLPGAYLTHQGGGAGTASTIGADYVRLALVGDLAQTKTGLARLVAILDHKK
ncbi:MAG: aminotransferase class I/II-fold pyridoxal phosphate-dependent enzyme, partial [Alphaproteobacteria bacterium]